MTDLVAAIHAPPVDRASAWAAAAPATAALAHTATAPPAPLGSWPAQAQAQRGRAGDDAGDVLPPGYCLLRRASSCASSIRGVAAQVQLEQLLRELGQAQAAQQPQLQQQQQHEVLSAAPAGGDSSHGMQPRSPSPTQPEAQLRKQVQQEQGQQADSPRTNGDAAGAAALCTVDECGAPKQRWKRQQAARQAASAAGMPASSHDTCGSLLTLAEAAIALREEEAASSSRQQQLFSLGSLTTAQLTAAIAAAAAEQHSEQAASPPAAACGTGTAAAELAAATVPAVPAAMVPTTVADAAAGTAEVAAAAETSSYVQEVCKHDVYSRCTADASAGTAAAAQAAAAAAAAATTAGMLQSRVAGTGAYVPRPLTKAALQQRLSAELAASPLLSMLIGRLIKSRQRAGSAGPAAAAGSTVALQLQPADGASPTAAAAAAHESVYAAVLPGVAYVPGSSLAAAAAAASSSGGASIPADLQLGPSSDAMSQPASAGKLRVVRLAQRSYVELPAGSLVIGPPNSAHVQTAGIGAPAAEHGGSAAEPAPGHQQQQALHQQRRALQQALQQQLQHITAAGPGQRQAHLAAAGAISGGKRPEPELAAAGVGTGSPASNAAAHTVLGSSNMRERLLMPPPPKRQRSGNAAMWAAHLQAAAHSSNSSGSLFRNGSTDSSAAVAALHAALHGQPVVVPGQLARGTAGSVAGQLWQQHQQQHSHLQQQGWTFMSPGRTQQLRVLPPSFSAAGVAAAAAEGRVRAP